MGACGVPRSQRFRETTGRTFQSLKTSGGLTKSWNDPKTARATVSPAFHTHWREVTKFENVTSQQSGRSIVINFQRINIQTVRYVRRSRRSQSNHRAANAKSHDHQGLATQFNNWTGLAWWLESECWYRLRREFVRWNCRMDQWTAFPGIGGHRKCFGSPSRSSMCR